MLRRRDLLRFFRLLVTVAALFVAHPPTTAVVVDHVVLFAGAEVAEGRDVRDARDVRGGAARASAPRADAEGIDALAPLQSTRALDERTFLLHCALLC